ncbi:myo-inosose-2 dehydratase [Ohessyouella blattaphilus]|uniref:Inosose dehydratase n=1 Tax=Ohessyouella blattaphilus TaxID=2949333 RepID=A0ABT1EFB1_9FIRM|nr:myo-inosose-2 dehydratase [Ohessyouella blattaphilus]MCP1109402.1 myo-inosose-2 dehydratase [Ohessyouella blattaphilus]MCR8562796.1 myo-inosose-2 dehydratase [Ohessyouella blattaphilus]
MLNKDKIKLGIAPIGWTNDDLPELGKENTFEQCVSEMALAGFTGTEIGNKYPKEPEVLKQALELRNMQICNCWFSTFFTTGEEAETIAAFTKQLDFLQAMGAKVIGCSEQGRGIQGKPYPIFGDQKPVFTKEEWQRLFTGMNKLGELAAARGMKCSLHHHMGTGIQTPEEIDIFMEGTNENVYLLFDSGHIYFSEGTQEAVDNLVEKYIDRIAHVHLKDVRKEKRIKTIEEKMSFLEAVKNGTFTVPGDGDIVFDKIFATLEKHNYEGWMLVEAEQDPAKANPLEYALKARDFIREKTGL